MELLCVPCPQGTQVSRQGELAPSHGSKGQSSLYQYLRPSLYSIQAAHTLFDDEPNEPQANLGAKHELSQSIFTKTMAIQVWKPDNERAGRHFVYTGRYVRFMTRLLYNLNDKTGMELLARRIRKRSGDFVDHAGVWEEVSRAYLQVRCTHNISESCQS